jgi:autotransporter-associated beta strand protein
LSNEGIEWLDEIIDVADLPTSFSLRYRFNFLCKLLAISTSLPSLAFAAGGSFPVSSADGGTTVEGSLGDIINNRLSGVGADDTIEFQNPPFDGTPSASITLSGPYATVVKDQQHSLTINENKVPVTIDGAGSTVFKFAGGGTFYLKGITLNNSGIENTVIDIGVPNDYSRFIVTDSTFGVGADIAAKAGAAFTSTNNTFNNTIILEDGALLGLHEASPDISISVNNLILTSGTVVVWAENTKATIAGAITGLGRLEIINSASLTLTNRGNTYSGGTLLTGFNPSVSGSTLSIDSDQELGAAPVDSTDFTGSVYLDGSTLQTTQGITSLRQFTLSANGGTLDVSNANATSTLNGIIRDNVGVGFTKAGPGTLVLGGANTYTSPTVVTGGTLIVSGSVVGNVTVDSGATLGGAGTIGGNVTAIGGFIYPTAGVLQYDPSQTLGLNTLKIGGDLRMYANSTYQCDIDPNGNSSQIHVSGAVHLDDGLGTSIVVNPLQGLGAYTVSQHSYVILRSESLNGTFATPLPLIAGSGYTFAQKFDPVAKTIILTITGVPAAITPVTQVTTTLSISVVGTPSNLSGAISDTLGNIMPSSEVSSSPGNTEIITDSDSFYFNPAAFAPSSSLLSRRRSAVRVSTRGQDLQSALQLLSQQGPLVLEQDAKRVWAAPYTIFKKH